MSTINPIIPGFAPDPSIVRIGDIFFIVTSSFHLFPGLPIYASKDLISRKQIAKKGQQVDFVSSQLGNAINRRTQLSLRRSNVEIWPIPETELKIQISGSLYAPTIRVHNGTVFVVCTNVVQPERTSSAPGSNSTENFVVSTKDIWSDQWSDPVYFDFYGIDPSIFVDDDGWVYIQGSSMPGAPYTKIHQFEIDLATGTKLSEEQEIWAGTGGIHPEGPHIYKKDGWYHHLVAEGGTFEGHMMTVARSTEIWGPYESDPRNLTLMASGDDGYVQHTGHCDMFQDDKGEWWGVCLGVRKDVRRRWPEGEWPSLDRVELNPKTLPQIISSDLAIAPASPLVEFVYIRDAELDKYKVLNQGGSIVLETSPIDLSDSFGSPTFIGKRQRQTEEKSEAVMKVPGGSHAPAATEHIKAGLVCYKDEQRFFRVCYDTSETAIFFEVWNNADKIHRTAPHKLDTAPASLNFRIEYTEKK
ncbi:hypothetical protein IFR05_016007 [Cadophora sp. M221]|nr:hypothetical protein IFR05_016007 [Cadophora sp. M221]